MENELQKDNYIVQHTGLPTLTYSNTSESQSTSSRERKQPESSDAPSSKKKKNTKEWNLKASGNFIKHGAKIYNKILIPVICHLIIDTPVFSRLGEIKQLGIVDRIFRQANHTRFQHSLGVADLARRVMKKLKKMSGDITGNDSLCVIIAALCRNLGHGPFSHCWDPIMEGINGTFKHQELSVKVFDYILETEMKVKKELDEYLTEEDFQFIRELINPPTDFFDSDGVWTLKGRPASKEYLYEIVNNPHHGFDIAKLDYLVRDSFNTGVNIYVNSRSISRYIKGIRIQEFDGRKRLTFKGKLSDEIPDAFNSRKSLFKKVYFHKKTYPLEYQLQKAIRLALPHLKTCVAREFKTLKECLTEPINIAAYTTLNDNIVTLIKNSEIDNPDMNEAKKCIERMERREIHTCILKITVCSSKWTDSFEQGIEKQIAIEANKIPGLQGEDKVIHKVRHCHFGKGPKTDPSSEVLYKSRCNSDDMPNKGSYHNLQSETILYIYGPHNVDHKDVNAFCQKMEKYLKHYKVNKKLDVIFKK